MWHLIRVYNVCFSSCSFYPHQQVVKWTYSNLSQQLSSAFSSACDFKSHFCKQWVHTVCLYAKIDLKSLQEYSADDINRWHFSDAGFLGILRVKYIYGEVCILQFINMEGHQFHILTVLLGCVWFINMWAAPWENMSLSICGQQRPRSAYTSARSDQGLRCTLTESWDTIECIIGEQKS